MMEHLPVLHLIDFEVLLIALGFVIVVAHVMMALEANDLMTSLMTARLVHPGTQLRFMHRGDAAFRKGVCILFIVCTLRSLVFKYIIRLLSFIFARYSPTVAVEANIDAAHRLTAICKYDGLLHFLF